MPRTSITKTGSHEVTLTGIDPMTDEPIRWVFWVPYTSSGSGYVRQGEDHSASNPQVCDGLERLGHTLTAADGDDLLEKVRREWQVYRKNAAKFWVNP